MDGDDGSPGAGGVIVCFGSINLDLIFKLPKLPAAGETILGPNLHIEPGGKGANQAVAAARDGAAVVFAGAIGRDALATDALALLRQSGIDLSRVVPSELATGAGDCYIGVLAAALDRGAEMLAALQRANAAAALACSKPGTQGSMPLAAETDGFLG